MQCVQHTNHLYGVETYTSRIESFVGHIKSGSISSANGIEARTTIFLWGGRGLGSLPV